MTKLQSVRGGTPLGAFVVEGLMAEGCISVAGGVL